jgi:hypothetical protein
MSSLRFNHVFAALLGLSVLSAFIIPPRFTDRAKPQLQMLFSPVSSPARALADRLLGKQSLAQSNGLGLSSADEIERLRVANASLSVQLENLKKDNADRAMLGDVRRLCIPARVSGAVAGAGNEILHLQTGGLQSGQVVIYSGGIVGRVEQPGALGAKVLLATDRRFSAEAAFGRFIQNKQGQIEFARIADLKPLVRGIGNGQMSAVGLNLKQAQDVLKEGDWVFLDDPDPKWPLALQGYKIGRIVSIAPWSANALMADIRIRPTSNLLTLREVMVVAKQ